MTTPVWSILEVGVLPQSAGHTNVVQSAKWQVSLRDTANIVMRTGETSFAPPVNGFTPYEGLTEAQVITWVKEALGSEATTLEAELQAELAMVSQPSVIYPPLPWKL